MAELTIIVKILTIFILLVLYGSGWAITYTVLRQENRETADRMFSVFWLALHGAAFIGFLIWSWL